MIAGTMGHCAGFASIYPFSSPKLLEPRNGKTPSGPMEGALQLVSEKGITVLPELYAGVGPTIFSQAVVKSMTIYTFSRWGNALLAAGLGGSVLMQVAAVLLAATATGMIAGAAMYPLESLAKRVNSGKEDALTALRSMAQHTFDAVRYHDEPLGLRGLARGADLTVMRETVGYSVFLSAHSIICWNFAWATSTWWGVALGGAMAGVVCFASICPFLNLSKLLGNGERTIEVDENGDIVVRQPETLMEAAGRVLRSQGFRTLFKGVGALMCQAVLANSVGFSTYRKLVPTIRSWILDASQTLLL
jgi:hypothetical protein